MNNQDEMSKDLPSNEAWLKDIDSAKWIGVAFVIAALLTSCAGVLS